MTGNEIGLSEMRGPAQDASAFAPLAPAFDPALLAACIHCGMCLPACPTYLATGRETESPRGRIYLLSQWQKGEQELTPRLAEHIDSCLGCLGCQTACPSGVDYAKILHQARPRLAAAKPARARRLARYIFARILPDYGKLRLLGSLIRWWQASGGRRFTARLPGLGKWLRRLDRWQSFLPTFGKFIPLPRQSWLSGAKSGQVQLFAGCVMDIFYNHVNHAAVRLLALQRQIVTVPEQTCCGALALHAGEIDIAQDLAKRNIELIEGSEGPIVVTAAGCGAMLKEYDRLLGDDVSWRDRARRFSERVVDLTEFLSGHEFSRPPRRLKAKVAYHAACHLCHAQRVREAPHKLLSVIEDLELVPLEEAEHCCGSAGIFNLTHTDLSLRILARKMMHIRQSGAGILVSTNPGCLMQLESGAKEAGLELRVCHLAEILDEAYAAESL